MTLTPYHAGKRTTARCPKCRKQNFTTREVFEEIVYITVEDGVFPVDADDHMPGQILGISCKCNNCGHRWRPRGAQTLDDLIADEREPSNAS